MRYTTILWDLDDDPDGNVQHIAEHGLSKTSTGRLIAVVYEAIDPDTVRPTTAFDVE